MFRSLRVRLAISHAFVMLVIVSIFAGLVLVLLAHILDRSATDQLAAEAGAQAERIQEGGGLAPTTDVDVPSASAVQIAVYRVGVDVPVGERKEIPSWLRPYPDRVTDLEVAGEKVRVVTLPAMIEGTTVAWVAAGRSLPLGIDEIRQVAVAVFRILGRGALFDDDLDGVPLVLVQHVVDGAGGAGADAAAAALAARLADRDDEQHDHDQPDRAAIIRI